MEISKRLQMIAKCVPENTQTVADIGTDHGYIPIYLINNKRAKYCIACDINPKPLSNAKKNIDHYQMHNQIETRLGSGLSRLAVGEVDAIIIAGMGGMLITDILQDDLGVVKGVGLLILQPQLDVAPLRRYLHAIKFKIVDEKMLYEDGKYYTIITAKAGIENAYTEKDYLFGKKLIEAKDIVLKDYICYKLDSVNALIANLTNKDTSQARKRLQEIKKERDTYKEVLECL